MKVKRYNNSIHNYIIHFTIEELAEIETIIKKSSKYYHKKINIQKLLKMYIEKGIELEDKIFM